MAVGGPEQKQKRTGERYRLIEQKDFNIRPALHLSRRQSNQIFPFCMEEKSLFIRVQKTVVCGVEIAERQMKQAVNAPPKLPGHRRQEARLSACRNSHQGKHQRFYFEEGVRDR
jgi:hypothetical protein